MLLFYFAQAAEFVSEAPGSLAYHLVLLAIFQVALALTLTEWRRERNLPNTRPLLVAAGLFLIAAVNFVIDLLAAAGLLEGRLLVPPLARAGSSLALVWMLWVLLTARPDRLSAAARQRPADALALTLSLVVVVAGSVSWSLWSQSVVTGSGPFNGSLHDSVWTIGQIVLLALGLLLLLVRRPADWGASALLVAGLLGVYTVHAFAPFGHSAPGSVRLGELVLMPAFVALLYRLAPSQHRAALPAPEAAAPASAPASLDAKTATALAALGSAGTPDDFAKHLAVAGAQAARAEFGLLISPPDELGTSRLLAAYDLARDQFLPAAVFTTADLPDYHTLLAKPEIISLRPQQQAEVLRRLLGAVGLTQIGPLLLLPLRANQQLVGVLAVANLSNRRDWPPETVALLAALGPILAEYLSPESKVNRLWRSLDKAQTQATVAEEARRAARLEADQLHIALESARTEAERLNSDILQLRQEMEGARSAEAVEAIRAAALAEQSAQFTEREVEWQEQSTGLEQSRDHWRTEAEALQTQLQLLQEKIEESERQRSMLAGELEPLRVNVAAFGAQTLELQRLQAELEHARAASEDALNQLAQSREELAAARQEAAAQAVSDERALRELHTRLADAQRELEVLQGHEAERHAQAERLIAELEAARAQQAQVLATQAQRETERQAQLEQLQSELAAAQDRQGHEARQAAEMRAEMARLTAETDHERQRAEAELRQLRERVETQEELLANWQLDYGAALEQEKRLRESLEAALANAAHAKAEWARAQAELTEARAASAAFSEQAAHLAEARAETEKLRQQSVAAEFALVEAQAALRARDDELGAARQTLNATLAQASRFANTQPELDQLRLQLRQARAELDVAQNHLNARNEELRETTGALAELSKLTQRLTHLQKQLAETERELAEARALFPAQSEGAARPFLPAASMEIIASLSQELRQPMSAIVGYSELLLGESVGILGALQRKFLERIKASCERMQNLLNDLINITDIDSGTLQLMPESVDMLNVIEDAIMSCGAQFREKGINLRLDVADSLPSLSADRDALRQIVLHLLSNAGNASGVEGEVLLRVREEVSPAYNGHPSSAVLIAVRDSGGGIAPADQPRVFNRFWRADAPLIAGLGETGVGLSVAKALVEAHGGRIWFTTEPGKGSTFTVLLPTDRPANGEPLQIA